MEEGRPLQNMAEAFKELSNRLNEFPEGEEAGLEVAAFVKACSSVSPLIRCLGGAFLYAEIEYVSKVKDLEEASKSVSVVAEMIDEDVRSDCVRKAGSHTRNLLRLKRVLDMIKILFEKIISTEGNSLKDQAIEAFSVFSSHHGFTIRKDVTAGMFDAFPTRAQLLIKLNEDESSSRIEMQKFISSAAQVGEYLDQLFNTRGLGTDW
ncbi:accelerated cell death 11-like [Salvia hispanica]|uniref:accelerated cell death 11-like n=1 Tax=Salvia hispanica TaxID=49212 RepID=UPI00200959C1|nr:accelerated cell death 11-like [Salvia hispanica]XP_047964104.1 accelerated cell death 11-like [Salvia hispanica]